LLQFISVSLDEIALFHWMKTQTNHRKKENVSERCSIWIWNTRIKINGTNT